MKNTSAPALSQASNHTQLTSSSTSTLPNTAIYRRTSSFKSNVDRNSLSSTGSSSNSDEGIILSLPHNSQLLHDTSVLQSWLTSIQFEEYIPLFISAGYDMPTIFRMTPADLTAIGITKPLHRRKLKNEISKLNISDGIPNFIPKSFLEWLKLIRLDEYFDTLCQQGYDSIDRVIQLTWEDLEEIGIKKLGHQKRLMLAIKRILDLSNGSRCLNNYNILPNSAPSSSSLSSESSSSSFPEVNHSCSSSHNLNLPVRAYHSNLVCQKVAINTATRCKAAMNSPTIETPTTPELKTFQQLPNSEPIYLSKLNSHFKSSTKSINSTSSLDGVIAGSQQAASRRSCESLNKQPEESESSKITAYLQQYMSKLQKQEPIIPVSNSHKHVRIISEESEKRLPNRGYENTYDSPIRGYENTYDSPIRGYENTYDSPNLLYDYDTIATLNRPRGLIKNKPIAKIIAKSRQDDNIYSSNKVIEHALVNEGVNEGKMIHTIDQISEEEAWTLVSQASNSMNKVYDESQEIRRINDYQTNESLATCATGIYGTLKKQKIPPPPPKRTNSMKTNSVGYLLFNGAGQNSEQSSLSSRSNSLDTMQDAAFATCVKSLTSRFSIPNAEKFPSLPYRNHTLTTKTLSLSQSDDNFPPPPSPLPHISYDESSANFIHQHQSSNISESSSSASSSLTMKEEKVNDSLALKDQINISNSSSTESMPFANDNIGTIKQKILNEECNEIIISSSKAPLNTAISHSSSTPSFSSFRPPINGPSVTATTTSSSPSHPNLSLKSSETLIKPVSKDVCLKEMPNLSSTVTSAER